MKCKLTGDAVFKHATRNSLRSSFDILQQASPESLLGIISVEIALYDCITYRPIAHISIRHHHRRGLEWENKGSKPFPRVYVVQLKTIRIQFKSNQIYWTTKGSRSLLQVAKTLDTVGIKPTSITCIHDWSLVAFLYIKTKTKGSRSLLQVAKT